MIINKKLATTISRDVVTKTSKLGMLVIYLLAIFFAAACSPVKPLINPSDLVRDEKDNRKIIIFVHGITGDIVNTWTGNNQGQPVYWPELLKIDPELSRYNIYAFSYYTPMLKKGPTIPQLGIQLNSELIAKGILPKSQSEVPRYDEIIFIAHSMGNLVVRQALQDRSVYQNVRVRLLISLAAPNAGSEVADIAKHITPNTTVAEMSPLDINAYLQALNLTWREDHPEVEIACGYELFDFPILRRRVVGQVSATYMCTRRPERPFNADHSAIVKPAGLTDPIHEWVRTEIQKPQSLGKPYKIILMDNAVLAYDDESRQKGLMNSHHIKHALSDLNVNMEIVPINEDVSPSDDKEILEKNPDLIIIHLSSFYREKQQFMDPIYRFRIFLNDMIQSRTKFIIYTRWKPEEYGSLDDFFANLLGDKKDILMPRIKLIDVRNPTFNGVQTHLENPSFKDKIVQNVVREQVKSLLRFP